MKLSTLRRASSILGLTGLISQSALAQTMLGFTPSSAATQARIESQFKAIPSAQQAQRQLRFLTAQPHPAGSARNNELARYIAAEWKKQGLQDIVIRRYDVFSSDPKETSLEMA